MPNYDYKCKKCGAEFSKTKSIKEGVTSRCPACKSSCPPQIGTPAFKVKGGTPKFHG